jgi:hypothetical protein
VEQGSYFPGDAYAVYGKWLYMGFLYISYPVGAGGGGALSLEVKHPRHEAVHLPPSITKVQNAWSCNSALLYVFILTHSLHGAGYYLKS